MKDIEPRFFDTENKIFAHLEWEAIRIIHFDGSFMNIADAYPKYESMESKKASGILNVLDIYSIAL